MKAVRITETGGPEALRVVELPVPEPGPGQILIRVAAAGVNFADTMQRAGTYPFPLPLPISPGFEAAGTVEALGPGVAAPAVGARVAAMMATPGAYAEYVAVDAAAAVPLPDGLGFGEATGLLVQGLTAYFLIAQAAPPRTGDSVLVTAAAGGVGSLAVQIARKMGAGSVIGLAGSDEKLALVRDLGADAAVNYREDGWPDRVREATGGRGPDVVLESVGGETGRRCLELLAPFGRLAVYGGLSGEWWSLSTEQMLLMVDRNLSVSGMALPNIGRLQPERVGSALTELFGWAAAGELNVVARDSFPLTEAAEAHRAMEGRRTVGKVWLSVP